MKKSSKTSEHQSELEHNVKVLPRKEPIIEPNDNYIR